MISRSLRESPNKVLRPAPEKSHAANCRSYDASEKSAWRSAKRNALSERPNANQPRRWAGLVATGGARGSCWVFLSPIWLFFWNLSIDTPKLSKILFWSLHLERFHFSQVVYGNCGISECCWVWSTWLGSPKVYLMFSGSKLVDAAVVFFCVCVCVCLLCLCSTSNFTCFQ